MACGTNDLDQIALGSQIDPISKRPTRRIEQMIPIEVTAVNEYGPMVKLACGSNHTLAQTSRFSSGVGLLAWGVHKHGQLGLPITRATSLTPRTVTSLAGVYFSCMACGGYNSSVVIGLSSEDDSNLNTEAISRLTTLVKRIAS